jgi:hypothetical protein
MKICSNGWKMVKLDKKIGDEKLSFWKKIARIMIFEKKIAIWQYFARKRNTGADWGLRLRRQVVSVCPRLHGCNPSSPMDTRVCTDGYSRPHERVHASARTRTILMDGYLRPHGWMHVSMQMQPVLADKYSHPCGWVCASARTRSLFAHTRLVLEDGLEHLHRHQTFVRTSPSVCMDATMYLPGNFLQML